MPTPTPSTRLQVDIPADLRVQLDAKREDTSLAAVVREALNDWLQKRKENRK